MTTPVTTTTMTTTTAATVTFRTATTVVLAASLAFVPAATPAPALADARASTVAAGVLQDLADELRPTSYRRPVPGPVVRPFERPAGTYGPGHRGIDLDVAPGTPVQAAERGRIRHAGQVAGVVWVSIDHPDGVRTTYGPLTGVRVLIGTEVERGTVIGLVAARDHGEPDIDRGLHLGAHRGGTAIDPLSLPGLGPPRPTLVGEGGWWGADHAVVPYAPWGGGRLGGVFTSPSPTAQRPGFATPPNANHLVVVAGLSSTSETPVLDAEHLGIGPASVTSFSYARDGEPYRVEDTWEGVEVAARRLEAQLRAQARRQPGRAVDLVGHSLGGVVIAHYLLQLHDPYDVELPPIGHVVTIASPLEGSDLARAGAALVDAPGSGAVLRELWSAAGSLPGRAGETARSLTPDAPSFRDVASGSPALGAIAQAWSAAREDGAEGPLATGTRVLNIVASRDGLVGADRAALEAAERRVLPGTHQGVLMTEAVREVVWRFLAGQEVVESPGRLATRLGAWYGDGLTAVSVLAGDRAAITDVTLPSLPVTEPAGSSSGW